MVDERGLEEKSEGSVGTIEKQAGDERGLVEKNGGSVGTIERQAGDERGLVEKNRRSRTPFSLPYLARR